jgi:steroid 5-alpha reductase family enzyme
MTILLLRVSGVALLERSLVRTRPEYRDYIARTSAFLPRPPSRGTP